MNKKLLSAIVIGASAMIISSGVMAEEPVKIGATFYTLQTEFCMRMDNYAKKYCEEQGIDYTSQNKLVVRGC